MRILRKLFAFCFSIFLLSNSAIGQYGDCSAAKDICKKDVFHVSAPRGEGNDKQEADFMHCFMNGDNFGQAEENSTWIKFEVKESGTFTFTITPDNPNDDIDFVVFRIPGGDCNRKEVVRCMAAGDQSDNAVTSRCMGKTGLRAGELDSSADAGCTDKDDNTWLAPLKTTKGEHYVLLISNVTGPRGFNVSFGGTAKLPCEEKPIVKIDKDPAKEKPKVKKTVPATPPIVNAKKTEVAVEKPKEINGRELNLSETVKVKSRSLKVKIWDSQIEDGDVISIYIDEKKVLDHYKLTTAPKEFSFDLPEGKKEHYLTVYADDFGRSEPNTAALIINDGSKENRIDMVSGRKKQDTLKIISE